MTGKRPSRPDILRGTRHVDPRQVVRGTVATATALVLPTELDADLDQGVALLDPTERADLAGRRAASIGWLQQLHGALTDGPAIRNALRCKTCGGRFDAPRSDARSCSPGCRQLAYRARKTETK